MECNTSPKPCAGRNCGAKDGAPHSPECLEDYERATACRDAAVLIPPPCGGRTGAEFDAEAKRLLGAAGVTPKPPVPQREGFFIHGAAMPPDLTTPEGSKDTNPKDGIGATKLPLSLVPATAIDVESLAFLNGALKYGRANWRACGVRASIYLDAALRHLTAWENGEEVDAEGVPHLGSARACIGIIIDAGACGKLTDDRPPSVNLGFFRAILTPIVASLTKLHADRKPRHWTIKDT